MRRLSYRPMPEQRPFDAHDDQERAEILAVLDELPNEHAARKAQLKARSLRYPLVRPTSPVTRTFSELVT
jgi:hypothetical protein